MKRSGRKTGSGDIGAGPEAEETPAFVPAEDTTASGKFHIDGIRAMQAIALGIAAIYLVWLVLRQILHVI